jgi:hypothetical protein
MAINVSPPERMQLHTRGGLHTFLNKNNKTTCRLVILFKPLTKIEDFCSGGEKLNKSFSQ